MSCKKYEDDDDDDDDDVEIFILFPVPYSPVLSAGLVADNDGDEKDEGGDSDNVEPIAKLGELFPYSTSFPFNDISSSIVSFTVSISQFSLVVVKLNF